MAGKREIVREVAEDALRCIEIGAAEDPVDVERARRFERPEHGFAGGTYHFEIAKPSAPPNRARDFLHGGERHADILEADVAHPKIGRGINEIGSILDGSVVAGQHEDEIHSDSGERAGMRQARRIGQRRMGAARMLAESHDSWQVQYL